jgi:hypothetical protein
MDAAALSDSSWRDQMRTSGEARTQAFAARLIAEGYNGLLVRSFAPGATREDMNSCFGGGAPPLRRAWF